MKLHIPLLLSCIAIICTSCEHSSGNVWEDTKTVSRHIERKTRILWGDDRESRAISSKEEFSGPVDEEFIPLQSDDLAQSAHLMDGSAIQPKDFIQVATTQPKKTSGYHIDLFKEPNGALAQVFTRVHFNTDDHILRKKEYYHAVNKMAEYLKSHPTTFVFVVGFCDQRASEAYNIALGSRRANSIRSLMIKRGVNPERIYTLSMGKEMPLDSSNNPEAWAKNRRVEFKIYSQE